jgi:nucleoside-diphosphate-sugar epimerase
MRFDLVLNNLAAQAWTVNEIRLRSDGRPWRPLIHICDLARAVAMMLEAPRRLVNRQVFNVGDDRLNHQVHKIANAVSRVFPRCSLTMDSSSRDGRSYKASFAKIREMLEFTCEHGIESGAEELCQLFRRIAFTQEMFESSSFDRLRWIQTLISSREVDENLFWVNAPSNADDNAASTIGA